MSNTIINVGKTIRDTADGKFRVTEYRIESDATDFIKFMKDVGEGTRILKSKEIR